MTAMTTLFRLLVLASLLRIVDGRRGSYGVFPLHPAPPTPPSNPQPPSHAERSWRYPYSWGVDEPPAAASEDDGDGKAVRHVSSHEKGAYIGYRAQQARWRWSAITPALTTLSGSALLTHADAAYVSFLASLHFAFLLPPPVTPIFSCLTHYQSPVPVQKTKKAPPPETKTIPGWFAGCLEESSMLCGLE